MDGTKAILMVVTSYGRIDAEHSTGLWFEEFSVPYELFNQEGYVVTVASVKGGAAPLDPRSLPASREASAVRAALEALQHTQRLMEVDITEYDAVFFPGGHGTMFDFPRNHEVAELVRRYLVEGKVVAALCHGPAALVGAADGADPSVLRGRRVTAFTNQEERAVQLDGLMPFLLESRLRELGAQVQTAPQWQDHVVVDGNLVTGQNPQSSTTAAQAVVRLLSA